MGQMDSLFCVISIGICTNLLPQTLSAVKSITADHIYTCYRQAKIRVPLNLENSLRITADQHNWIRTTRTGKMSLTTAGKQYVEKQLPKKVKH